MDPVVIGVDFGTDSVRAVVLDAASGTEHGKSVVPYPRWQSGLYCDPSTQRFRQHPLDYIESLTQSIQGALHASPDGTREAVIGIGVDTTGSTPVAVDKSGTPLALLPGFEEDPDAMFILWKDHTAIREAAEINELCRRWETDYTRYEGGVYSSEWFWAKILRTLRANERIREAAYSWVEHCDWIPFLMTGGADIHQMKRSRCAAGHKALWHPDFGGLPPNSFFTELDPLLDGLRERLFQETYTSDQPAGTLSPEWAEKLGLHPEVVVAVGAFDAHMGAVGAEIKPFYLSKVMGTSTCDILVAPEEKVGANLIQGICGQVHGSVLPGMIGLEAGQSAFGDVYAWFRQVLLWPFQEWLGQGKILDKASEEKILRAAEDRMLDALQEAASQMPPGGSGLIALDWLNGRRTPDADQSLKGALFGLHLGTDAPLIFQALVEATCFGARKIVERFQEEGVPIKGIIGLGGVAKKSPYIMQTLAHILNRPIQIVRSEETCALGAAMFAATAAGYYSSAGEAMNNMGSGFEHSYHPDPEIAARYDLLYRQYEDWGSLVEQMIHSRS